MNFFYTPHDIAVFLMVSNFAQGRERIVLHDIWKNKNTFIPAEFRENETLFRRCVYDELFKIDGTIDDIDELNLLLQDVGVSFCIKNNMTKQDIIESYFKIIKLELYYITERNHQKIKFRRLLNRFNYKRRSAKLMKTIKNTLNALELKTYLRGRVPCDVAKISIDDVIIIRL